jgi:tetratricopeptide (TPR) repeat protein
VTNDRNMQVLFQRGVKDAWFPTDMFSVAADSAAVFGSGTLQPGDTTWVPRVNWKIERQVLMKNHLLVLDMLANNNWQRPIYFAVTTGPDSYINLQDHFQLEGLTYRLVPAYSPNRNPNMNGRVATDIMYHNVMDKFKWGNMDTEGEIYLDENILRMTTNLRLQLSSLAEALIEEGRMAEAENVLDLSLAKMPERNVPYDRILLPTVEAYYALKKNEKANALTERLFSVMEENMAYYLSLDAKFAEKLQQELSITHAVMGRLTMSATAADSTFGQGLQQRFEAVEEQYQGKLMEMRSGRKAGGRMRF